MAKATAPDTTALSVSEAAAAIVSLINSRAQSPWPQEIEAIIARTIAPKPMASPRAAPAGRRHPHEDCRVGGGLWRLGQARQWAGVRRGRGCRGEAESRAVRPGRADT